MANFPELFRTESANFRTTIWLQFDDTNTRQLHKRFSNRRDADVALFCQVFHPQPSAGSVFTIEYS